MDYCLPPSYVARLEPDDVVIEPDERFWQPDVHAEAAALAKRLRGRCIVGLGCGAGQKLAALYPSFEIVGIDNSVRIADCRERYEFGTWLEVDFDRDESLGVSDLTDSILVCENLIERLIEPVRLLTLVSDALDRRAAALVLSTPDRELMNDAGHLGPPANPANVREWTRGELKCFLASAGLTGHFGLTRWSDLAPSMRTILAVVPGRSPEQREAVGEWWEERARWQQLVEEQDLTIAQQQAWTRELRESRDWLAQHAVELEAALATERAQFAVLEAALATERAQFAVLKAARERISLRWALDPARRFVHVARRGRLRR